MFEKKMKKKNVGVPLMKEEREKKTFYPCEKIGRVLEVEKIWVCQIILKLKGISI